MIRGILTVLVAIAMHTYRWVRNIGLGELSVMIMVFPIYMARPMLMQYLACFMLKVKMILIVLNETISGQLAGLQKLKVKMHSIVI